MTGATPVTPDLIRGKASSGKEAEAVLFCKDCDHFGRRFGGDHRCIRLVKSEVDVVTGTPHTTFGVLCHDERQPTRTSLFFRHRERCGPDAKFFVLAPPPSAPPPPQKK